MGSRGTPSLNQKELATAVYNCCSADTTKDLYFQEDFLAFGIIPNNNVQNLLAALQDLSDQSLIKLLQHEGRACWRIVPREDAAKYRELSMEEMLVYSYIESAQRQGMWVKTIVNRSNLHVRTVNDCIKTLEKKNYIKSVVSLAASKKKTYIISKLQPAEDLSGGLFFTDGILDEEFIHQLCEIAYKIIEARSFQEVPIKHALKRKSQALTAVEDSQRTPDDALVGGGTTQKPRLVPFPPGYVGYPRVPEITKTINGLRIAQVAIKEADVHQLMNILVWDGRVEKVRGAEAFKAVRQPTTKLVDDDEALNGLTEAPCGKCPVFDLCEEGGVVNAEACTYFQDWLQK